MLIRGLLTLVLISLTVLPWPDLAHAAPAFGHRCAGYDAPSATTRNCVMPGNLTTGNNLHCFFAASNLTATITAAGGGNTYARKTPFSTDGYIEDATNKSTDVDPSSI